ncbi:MAG TPA: BON domain-containing protein [Opitutaceae bacterium]|nr:BON domain-containing protein [Opitutaceae bacterium]
MKTAFIFFLLGAVAGAWALNYYNQREAGERSAGSPAASGTTFTAKARDAANQAGEAITEKLVEWHLTADDIKADLARTGAVVRSKAAVAGEKISDARIVTVIKSKYVLDRELSAIDINVDCRDGEVTLRGTVASNALIGRATALALDTDGVHNVTARLAVAP